MILKKLTTKMLGIVLASALIFTGCATDKKVEETPKDDKLTIVSSFYPMYISLLNIADGIENVEVKNMTEQTTGCLHDYSVTTENMKTLEDADVFVINGAGMESFMEKVTTEITDLKIVEASEGIELIKGDGEEGDNPHVWVSISENIKQVENMRDQLVEIDPDNGDKYKENADEYIEKLNIQKDKMHEELDNIKNKDIITFHEAFPYFAREFNLNIVGVIEREPGSEPDAKELQETIEKVKELKVKALFAEPQYPAKSAESIATETGTTVYTLDPAVTGTMDKDAYITIMENNLKVLKEALS
ncbi:metal ABC transporter substrate-binding protein [Clostridium vincentii]|nr:metal ABC transporter substrate-binding protein [Clostridium vincentii]